LDNEKRATSDPEIKAENKSKTRMPKIPKSKLVSIFSNKLDGSESKFNYID